MTYGSELEPVPATVHTQPVEKAEEELDRFDEGIYTHIELLAEIIKVQRKICVLVVEEIEERRLFLSEMEALGQGKAHRNRIMTEISQVMLRYMFISISEYTYLISFREFVNLRRLIRKDQHNL